MKRRSSIFLLVGILAPTVAAGIALATEGSGVTGVAHVAGARLTENVQVNADRIKFQTKRPTDVTVLTLTVERGGTTGWHSHPGLALIAVTEGRGTLRFSDCSSRSVRAGQAFVESGDDAPTEFRNETAERVVLTVTFVAPESTPVLRDEARPDCD